ncbi:hypothetical protein [Bradyrhizobium sp. 62]|nr:hypothetical protein [Bradyrhizobium sp. 62]MCK1365623.1 hypothetical protein [Bradyrhizobium sp. 62]
MPQLVCEREAKQSRIFERSEAIQSAAAEGFWIASAFAKASADKSLRSQ